MDSFTSEENIQIMESVISILPIVDTLFRSMNTVKRKEEKKRDKEVQVMHKKYFIERSNGRRKERDNHVKKWNTHPKSNTFRRDDYLRKLKVKETNIYVKEVWYDC